MGHLAARRGSIVACESIKNKQTNNITNKQSSPALGKKSLGLQRDWAPPGKYDTSWSQLIFPWLAWKLICLELFTLEGSNYSSPSRCKLSFAQREQGGGDREMVGCGEQAQRGEKLPQVVPRLQTFLAAPLVGGMGPDCLRLEVFSLGRPWDREAHLSCLLYASSIRVLLMLGEVPDAGETPEMLSSLVSVLETVKQQNKGKCSVCILDCYLWSINVWWLLHY